MALDLPIDEAMRSLRGREVAAIETHFGVSLSRLAQQSEAKLLIGLVWVYENREGKRSWTEIGDMTLTELSDYFAPEPADPDSDEGKGSPSDATPTASSPSGVSLPDEASTSTTA